MYLLVFINWSASMIYKRIGARTMRLIIISNRLPLTIKRCATSFSYKETSGGLVTGLKAVKQTLPFLWIGNISGMTLSSAEKETITKDCWELNKSIPVFISKDLNEQSYNGFCNGILWPILHTFPDDVSYDPKLFDSYKQFNEIFCEKIVSLAQEGDIIWVHDYHLMLLPNMLRQRLKLKQYSIGFFLHTPFSPSDVFGMLPCVKEIVKGVLGSDHVAFHSYDYLAHFLDTCSSVLPFLSSFDKEIENNVDITKECKQVKKLLQENIKQIKTSKNSKGCKENENEKESNQESEKTEPIIDYYSGDIALKNYNVRCMAIPIDIEPSLFRNALEKPEAKNRIADLKNKYKGKKIIIGVDRTDYIKGIPNRIKGLHQYLTTSTQNVVFLQICVPSRLDVPEYSTLMQTINIYAAELNGAIGNVDEQFMQILCKGVAFEELCALYAVADVCCISSLMDGMNLVALEFVACQDQNCGVLMLSEFAGCASTLPGSIFFNPWNKEEMAEAFEKALSLGVKERADRHKVNADNVNRFTAVKWAKDNVNCLQEINGNIK